MKYKILLIVMAINVHTFLLHAQGSASMQEKPPVNWQLMDLKEDGFFGVSMEKAYSKLLKRKKAKTTIVAVIDGGVDLNHEELKPVIWANPKEIPDNDRDDDHNGYVDDIHGWNLMATEKGSFYYDNMEVVRQLRRQLAKDPRSEETMKLWADLRKRRYPLLQELYASNQKIELLKAMIRSIGKEKPLETDFRKYRYQSFDEERLLTEIIQFLKVSADFDKYRASLEDRNKHVREQLDYLLNLDYNPRAGSFKFPNGNYGNGDVQGQNPVHGTHVAGIIAAVRNNNIGMNGVADQVKLMILRTIPMGETVDEDFAKSIRYAVDNGARVINLSTGKVTSANRALVDEAVKYAMLKDVLIVHAAGNFGVKQDTSMIYPRKKYLEGEEAKAWIEVGASGYRDNEDILAWFSNYGQNIDVFAPGVEIYSTLPGNKYGYENGTSMAAPIVSGIAGMLRAYYPKLSAVQIKEILMKSVTKVEHPINIVSTGEKLSFSLSCKSGGIVNAYEAFKLAATY